MNDLRIKFGWLHGLLYIDQYLLNPPYLIISEQNRSLLELWIKQRIFPEAYPCFEYSVALLALFTWSEAANRFTDSLNINKIFDVLLDSEIELWLRRLSVTHWLWVMHHLFLQDNCKQYHSTILLFPLNFFCCLQKSAAWTKVDDAMPRLESDLLKFLHRHCHPEWW